MTVESHMMLDVSVQRDGRVIYSNLALNEALIARGNISRVDPAADLLPSRESLWMWRATA